MLQPNQIFLSYLLMCLQHCITHVMSRKVKNINQKSCDINDGDLAWHQHVCIQIAKQITSIWGMYHQKTQHFTCKLIHVFLFSPYCYCILFNTAVDSRVIFNLPQLSEDTMNNQPLSTLIWWSIQKISNINDAPFKMYNLKQKFIKISCHLCHPQYLWWTFLYFFKWSSSMIFFFSSNWCKTMRKKSQHKWE